jgi:thiol-disulfide isomerase/thioredoxin
MLTRILFVLVLFFNFQDVIGQIKFVSNWNEAIKIAKAANKLIYLDIYTTWCGPCKIMAQNYHTNEQVGALFNKNFVCLKLDAEKGEGIIIAKKYKTNSYPSNYFIDPNSLKIIHFEAGCPISLEGFLDYATKVKTIQEDSVSITDMHIIFRSKIYNSDFLQKYLYRLKSLKLNNNEAINAYILKIPEGQSMDSTIQILWKFTETFNNNALEYFAKNKDISLQKISSKYYSVQQLFQQKLQSSLKIFIQNKNDSLINISNQIYLQLFPDETLTALEMTMDYFKGIKNYQKHYLASKLYFEALEKKDSNFLKNKNDLEKSTKIKILNFQLEMMKILEAEREQKVNAKIKSIPTIDSLYNEKIASNINEIAFEIFLHFRKDSNKLNEALTWCNKAITLLPIADLQTLPYLADTKASLLFALNKKNEAIANQKNTILLIPKSELDLIKQLETNLKKMQLNTL